MWRFQIIGVCDTGLDLTNAFFYDPAYVAATGLLAPFQSAAVNTMHTPSTQDLTHRKVVQYITYSDNGDYADGHGTKETDIWKGLVICSCIVLLFIYIRAIWFCVRLITTHVSGSLAGKLIPGSSAVSSTPDLVQFQGQAPDARLAVFDAGGPNEDFSVPVDLEVGMLEFAYMVNVVVW